MEQPAAKREYERPRLTVYGAVQMITLSNVTMNMNDSMSGSFSMT